MRVVMLLVGLLMLTACQSPGPVAAPDFPERVGRALPANDSKPLMVTAARFTRLDDLPSFGQAFNQALLFRAGPNVWMQGVAAITDDRLYLLIWQDKFETYQIQASIRLNDVDTYQHLPSGVSRLIFKTRTPAYNILPQEGGEFVLLALQDNGVIVDNRRTDALVQIFEARLEATQPGKAKKIQPAEE